MSATDAAIAELAATQHGVVTLEQLRKLGLTASAVLGRGRAGRLHRLHRGVYTLAPVGLLGAAGRWHGAVLACGPGAVLSHRSAAALLGLRATARAGIDVTVPRASHLRRPGIDIHRSATLGPSDVMVVDGIPCTTVARTQLDLADAIRPRQLERTLDQAAAMEVLDRRALDDQCARSPTRPAAARLGAVLRRHVPGRTPTWSDLEEAFLAVTRSAGLPDPEVNSFIVPGDGEPAIRADFQWRERRLVIETDGWGTHRTRASFERDRRNDLRLTVAGYRAVRTTWQAITGDPDTLRNRIVTLYEARL
ncbi:MAG: type IV toxin-antitoxin system AbiEi family antitoxin domain-containing protein [Solirubrobacteraceae bacterium]